MTCYHIHVHFISMLEHLVSRPPDGLNLGGVGLSQCHKEENERGWSVRTVAENST